MSYLKVLYKVILNVILFIFYEFLYYFFVETERKFTFVSKELFTMINSSEFTKRIKNVMDYHELSASLFADKIGVQRSSISHILSGRNKPSLDFILKVTSEFKDVDIHWLLNGKGSFPKNVVDKESSSPPTLFSTKEEHIDRKIQRIVVFYSDGTFDEYQKQ